MVRDVRIYQSYNSCRSLEKKNCRLQYGNLFDHQASSSHSAVTSNIPSKYRAIMAKQIEIQSSALSSGKQRF